MHGKPALEKKIWLLEQQLSECRRVIQSCNEILDVMNAPWRNSVDERLFLYYEGKRENPLLELKEEKQ